MAGGTAQGSQQVNWQDKYIDRLSQDMNGIREDMREIRGMETRMNARFDAFNERIDTKFDSVNERIDALSSHMQSIATAAVIGIGAIIVTIAATAWLR